MDSRMDSRSLLQESAMADSAFLESRNLGDIDPVLLLSHESIVELENTAGHNTPRRVRFGAGSEGSEHGGEDRRHWLWRAIPCRAVVYAAIVAGCVVAALVCHFGLSVDARRYWSAYLTVAILIMTIVLLIDNYPPEIVLFTGCLLLIAFGVVPINDALSGYAKPNNLAIAVLFIVATGVQESGVMEMMFRAVLGSPKYTWVAQVRLLVPVGIVSAVLNNTPVVAMMIPMVLSWSARTGIPAAKLLIPLSYVSMLGGTCTLIGSSTNLAAVEAANVKLGFFDLAWVGIPLFLIGVLYMVVASTCMLNSKGSDANTQLSENAYSVMFHVDNSSPLKNETIEASGLLRVGDTTMTAIMDRHYSQRPLGPLTVIQSGDYAVFAATASGIRDLRKFRGFVPVIDQLGRLGNRRRHRRMFEVVISRHCSFVGQTVREARFRSRFNGVIIAVRSGDPHRRRAASRSGSIEVDLEGLVPDDVGDHRFHPGDTLLVETMPNFYNTYRTAPHFALISEVEGSKPPRNDKTMDVVRLWVSFGLLLGMVVTTAMDWLDLFVAASFCAGALIAIKCLTIGEAMKSIRGDILIIIASTSAIGKAMQTTGISDVLAHGLLSVLASSKVAAMFGIYAMVVCLGSVINNVATVNLMWPVAQVVADQLHTPQLQFLYVVIFAASASYATPIGYQTNLMVMGPGGYSFLDFVIFGGPMQLVMAVCCIPLILVMYPEDSLKPI